MTQLSDDFGRLREKIRSVSFQENQGLSNEIGYYIFDYRPQDELVVRNEVAEIARTSTRATIGADVLVIDVFDLVMSIIDEWGYTESFEELERTNGMSEVIKQANNILEMNEDQTVIVKKIQERIQGRDHLILFLTGIGKIFPVIRAHKILNTMNQVIDQFPVVMFYPGEYDGLHLKMFGELTDDNYYRAFSLRMEWDVHED